MKFGLILLFSALLVLVLNGCATSQSFDSPEITSMTAEPTLEIFPPTPVITETITSTNSYTWENGIKEIFHQQCFECHGTTPTGGFSFETYNKVMQGSNIGKIIIPGNPDESHLFIKLKYAGNHPGYLSPEQTTIVWEWVKDGSQE